MKQELKIKLRRDEDIKTILEFTRDGNYVIIQPKNGMKICNKCFFVWKRIDFSKNKKSPDGLRSECKNCSCTINDKSKAEMQKLYEIFRIAIKNKDNDYFPFDLNETYYSINFFNLPKAKIKELKSIMFEYYDKLQE